MSKAYITCTGNCDACRDYARELGVEYRHQGVDRDRLEVVVPEEPVRRQAPVTLTRRDPLTWLTVAAVIAILILAILNATPRSAMTAIPTVAGSMHGAASGNPSWLSEAPLPVGASLALVTGRATWYDAPSIHDAAAGPGLRRALGSHWRGSVVRVSSGGHSVIVTLSDWCACRSGNRVIDLDDRAFARLAPLSAGVIAVSITVVGGIDEPVTATAPTGPPTDLDTGGNTP